MKNLLIALLLLAFSTAYSQEDKKVYGFKTEEDIYEGNGTYLGEYSHHYFQTLILRDSNGKKVKYKTKDCPFIAFSYDEILYVVRDKNFLGLVFHGPIFLFASSVTRIEGGVNYSIGSFTFFSDGLFGEPLYAIRIKKTRTALVEIMKPVYSDIAKRLENIPNSQLKYEEVKDLVKEYNARFREDMEE